VTVTDKNGCQALDSVTITQPAQLNVNGTVIKNVGCHGNSDGIVSATISGGTSPYTYLWYVHPAKTTDTLSGLISGTYTVHVTDKDGCTASASVTITQPDK
jgi:hypothetical protein